METKHANAMEKGVIECQKKVGSTITKTKWVHRVVTKWQGFSHKHKVKLTKKSGSRDMEKWLHSNSTAQNQCVSTRQAENTNVTTTASSMTVTAATDKMTIMTQTALSLLTTDQGESLVRWRCMV